MRELTREGTQWSVHEVDTTGVPGARGGRCLIVESEHVVRRIWSYPPNWASLGDDTLWDLLDRMWAAHDAERERLETHCTTRGRDLRHAALAYAEALKGDGVAPERALVMLKAAVQKGLGVSHCDGETAEDILRETVECCIDAYFSS